MFTNLCLGIVLKFECTRCFSLENPLLLLSSTMSYFPITIEDEILDEIWPRIVELRGSGAGYFTVRHCGYVKTSAHYLQP
jgi:hypothetical protein